MRLKCDRCGLVTAHDFPTGEVRLHAADTCAACGHPLLTETDIRQAVILADLEDKGLLFPVGADSDRAMLTVSQTGVTVNEQSTEPAERRKAATRDFAAYAPTAAPTA